MNSIEQALKQAERDIDKMIRTNGITVTNIDYRDGWATVTAELRYDRNGFAGLRRAFTKRSRQ